MREEIETWEKIAESFNSTRKKPWKRCLDFIDRIVSSALVLDIGCGNGRHLIPSARRCRFAVGVDISFNMLTICRKNLLENNITNFSLVRADATNLPFRDNTFDFILFIASLHNIRGRQQRVNALREVGRVMKDGGKALITVWARWQDRFLFTFLVELFLRRHEEFGDIEVMWKRDSLNISRFYHLYSVRELVKDIREAGLKIEKVEKVKISSRYLADNIFAYLTK